MIHQENTGKKPFFTPDIRFSKVLLISVVASCILYSVFYALSEWIWSFGHVNIPGTEFTPRIREFINEYDGIESIVLYSMMFIAIFLTTFFVWLLTKLTTNKIINWVLSGILIVVAGYYLFCIGFNPPGQNINTVDISLPIILVAVSVGLYLLYKKKKILSQVIMMVIIAFAGIISIGLTSPVDLSYVLAPALRLVHGYKFHDIYFQYDLFLSLLAYAWMKLNFTVEGFAYLGQFSYFLLFIGLFFFSDKFFKSRGLPVLFILSLILIRLFLEIPGNETYFQVAPIRLDLWLILLLLVYKKGIYHWSCGFSLGLLVLFHRNLGLLYLFAYVQLVFILFLFTIIDLKKENRLTVSSVIKLLVIQLKLNIINIALITVSFSLCFILFGGLFSESAVLYRSIGIGMIRISSISFYWYMPIIFSCLFILLSFYRKKFGTRYTTTALLILFFAIGNSMYFFGRSHENNIINVSSILVLTVFVLFDMLIFLFPGTSFEIAFYNSSHKSKSVEEPPINQPPKTKIRVYVLLPVLFIMLMGYYYSKNIGGNLQNQFNKNGSWRDNFSFGCYK